jgi:hypothetical protein
MKRCVRCEKEIVGSTSRTYCSDSCRIAANAEAAAERREVARRERRRLAARKCVVCGAQLSMYGHGNTCALCINPKPLTTLLKNIKAKI